MTPADRLAPPTEYSDDVRCIFCDGRVEIVCRDGVHFIRGGPTDPDLRAALRAVQEFLDRPETSVTGRRDIEHSYRDAPLKRIRAQVDAALQDSRPDESVQAQSIVVTAKLDGIAALMRNLNRHVERAALVHDDRFVAAIRETTQEIWRELEDMGARISGAASPPEGAQP